MTEIAIPRRPDEITPEWATQVLRADGCLQDGRVASVAIEAIGVGRGYVGQTLRIGLEFEGPPGRAPPSIVAKLPTFVNYGPEVAQLVDLLYATEISWYRDLRAETPVRAPHSFWGGSDPESHRFCLVLEDLGHLRTADQVGSCSIEEAGLIVRNLARMHARWWESPRLDAIDWLPTAEEQGLIGRELYLLGWQPFWERLGPPLAPGFEALGRKIGPAMIDISLAAAGSAKTLVHGDYRLENFLFGEPGSDDELVVLDWQIVGHGSGLRDLAYFLGQNLTVEVRRANEERLLHLYYEGIQEGGVRGYSFASCFDDYRRGLLLAMLVPVNGVRALNEAAGSGGGLTDVQQAMVQQAMDSGLRLISTMAERNVAAILDNAAGELLP